MILVRDVQGMAYMLVYLYLIDLRHDSWFRGNQLLYLC